MRVRSYIPGNQVSTSSRLPPNDGREPRLLAFERVDVMIKWALLVTNIRSTKCNQYIATELVPSETSNSNLLSFLPLLSPELLNHDS